jgi:hypothetical protein
MEDVLDLYAEPYDPQRPQVCFDESPVQLVSETRRPLPRRPGQPECYDYEYKRQGTANLFLFVQPLRGWRQVNVTARRTKQDFAQQMHLLVDIYFPEADRIRLVVDNLNTHTPAALYEAFAPAEARRITRKLDFHYTPKHGSWLNMAECEFAVLGDFSKRTSRTRLPPLGESECATWVIVDCAPSALLPHASPPCSVTRLFGRSCG